jgi:rhamnose utilization protein RhaD (predicted bifunctional aldolase and dehydrogenase)
MLDLTLLLELSAKLGQNLDLVQAGGGNTSLKDNGTLSVKASGKWLVHALEEEMFIPVERAGILRSIDEDREYVHEYRTQSGVTLRPSVETSMHAVIPHQRSFREKDVDARRRPQSHCRCHRSSET